MCVSNCQTYTASVLPELAIIAVRGDNRVQFLQGQLTNDITRLADQLMTAGACTPKGRLLATPRLFNGDDTIYMIVDAAGRDMLIKRLKMFILRSRVSVEPEDNLCLVGLVGTPDEVFSSSCFKLFRQSSASVHARLGLALPEGRWLAVMPKDLAPDGDANIYWSASIAAGDPWVFKETRESFVPQGINLELVAGISFSKGCYTGQEVVSRVEHIGKTPRRAALFAADAVLPLNPGDPVYDGDGNPCGIIVQSAINASRTVLLVQCSVSDTSRTDMQINAIPLIPIELPYGYTRQS